MYRKVVLKKLLGIILKRLCNLEGYKYRAVKTNQPDPSLVNKITK